MNSFNDDLYQSLSTFTFGEHRTSLSPSPSPSYEADVEQDDFITPLTHSIDRTPRPSLSFYPPQSRRSSKQSIPKSTDSPLLFSNYLQPSTSWSRIHQHRLSDASQHTFGAKAFPTPSLRSTGSASRPSSRSSSRLEFSSDEEFDYKSSSSPVTFARDTEDTSLDDDDYPGPTLSYPRRGSLPVAIPNATPPITADVGDPRRDSNMATRRRPSRSLDDDLRAINVGGTIGPEPKSEPASRGDWASLEAHLQAQNDDSELGNVYQELGLNLDYVLGAGGEPGRRSSDALSYVQAQQRRSSQGGLAWAWNAAGRRPSTGTVGTNMDDTFARHVRKWDGGRVGNWSFKREKADGTTVTLGPRRGDSILSPQPSFSDTLRTTEDKAKAKGKERVLDKNKPEIGMLPGTQEIWRCEFVGRFKVDRQTVQQPSKPPHQRLNLRHIIDPYSRGNTRGGPSVTIHKHSRTFAFSIYRAHSLSGRHRARPGILLAPKRVQEQFTSTKTTSKLATHGLLEDEGASSGRSRASSSDKREKESEKQRKKREAAEAAKAKKEAKKAGGTNSQTSSAGSTSSNSMSATSSLAPPVEHTYPPAPAVIRRESSAEFSRPRPPSASTSHVGPRPSTGTSLGATSLSRTSISDQSTIRDFYTHRSSKPPPNRRDSFDIDGPPSRTPHAETYATLDSSLIEYMRARADNRLPETDPNPSFFRRFLRPGPRAAVQPPNYPAGPTSASLEGQYKAPWLSLVGRAKQEETDRVIHNLNTSFMGVGLLPANNTSKPARTRGTHPKKVENVNILEQVPDDSPYMLLPLWPGETDPASAASVQYGAVAEGCDEYDVPLEERQYLLVYYVAFDQPIEKVQGRRSRPQTSSGGSSSTPEERGIMLSEFRAVARVVSYNELRGTGVRLPSEGLSMIGPMWEAVQHIPVMNCSERLSFVIATCLGRDHVEIVPEGLVKMGLCLPMPERQIDPDAGEWEEDAVLSPIGRAAVEMAWAGCMALTCFGTA